MEIPFLFHMQRDTRITIHSYYTHRPTEWQLLVERFSNDEQAQVVLNKRGVRKQ
jgi:hypothetical protein